MIQEHGKYLYMPFKAHGGLDVGIHGLVTVIQTALAMKRIPVIKTYKSSGKHRLGNKFGEPVHVDWNRYINLSETKIFKVLANGIITKISKPLQYVDERDFNLSSYSKDKIRYINSTQIYDKGNDQYPVIYIVNRAQMSPGKRTIPNGHINRLPQYLSVDFDTSSYFISLSPSKIVNDLTEIVLNDFGTTIKSMKFLANILYDLSRFECSEATFSRKELNYYACMHVRYGGRGEIASKLLTKTAELRGMVERVVYLAYKNHPEHLPLYIMSNIRETHYFNFLKPKYDLYRYTDFKELREQFKDQETIDHNLLYSVEKNIMEYATVRIFSFTRNRYVFEYPWQDVRNIYERVFKK